MPVPIFSVNEVLTSSAMNQVGLWLVKETTVTNQPAITVDSCFSNSYTNYRIVINAFCIDQAARTLRGRLRSNTTTIDANYNSKSVYWKFDATATPWTYNVDTSAFSIGPISYDANNGALVSIDIYRPFEAKMTSVTGINTGNYYGEGYAMALIGGVHTANTSYNGFSVLATGGNITGTVAVYGYRKGS